MLRVRETQISLLNRSNTMRNLIPGRCVPRSRRVAIFHARLWPEMLNRPRGASERALSLAARRRIYALCVFQGIVQAWELLESSAIRSRVAPRAHLLKLVPFKLCNAQWRLLYIADSRFRYGRRSLIQIFSLNKHLVLEINSRRDMQFIIDFYSDIQGENIFVGCYKY